jgi:hypothetical protein
VSRVNALLCLAPLVILGAPAEIIQIISALALILVGGPAYRAVKRHAALREAEVVALAAETDADEGRHRRGVTRCAASRSS